MDSTCSIPGCNRSALAREFCGLHYQRWRRNGAPVLQPTKSVEQRFWEKVEKTETCWLWTAGCGRDGYGYFNASGSAMVGAHRVAYQWLVGPIPDGMQLDHTCHVRRCVNPAHLQPVTAQKNQENRPPGRRKNNTSGVRGVSWSKQQNKWQVYATVKRKMHHGGFFDSLADAEQAAIALRNRLMTNNLIDRST